MASIPQTAFGNPSFGIVHINVADVAFCFQAYLNQGSKLTGVSLDQINRGVSKAFTNPDTVTLVELLEAGMKLFDAIVWLSADRPKSHPLKLDPAIKTDDITPLNDVAKALFYVFFFLMTQARYPPQEGTINPPHVPAFLNTLMGLTKPPHEYNNIVCSFNINLFDPKWIRHIKFDGLGQEALTRYGLGVAGYRLFGPFKHYNVKAGVSEEVARAARFAKTVATKEPTWDIHPITRSPNVLTKRGNLNKNLGNLILECFTQEDIEEMAAAKIIFKAPIRDPQHLNWKTWDEVDDISGDSKIF